MGKYDVTLSNGVIGQVQSAVDAEDAITQAQADISQTAADLGIAPEDVPTIVSVESI